MASGGSEYVPADLEAEVLIGHAVSPQQEQDVTVAFLRLGVAVRSRRVLDHRGPAEWLVLVVLPLQAFLSGLGAEAVRDAYAALKRVITGLLEHRGESSDTVPPLVLRDAASDLRVVFDADLPVEAYRQLATLDLSRFRQGPLHYDRALGRWRSELDEADPNS